MFGAQQPLKADKRAPTHKDCLVSPPCLQIGCGEVAQRFQGLRVIGSQYPSRCARSLAIPAARTTPPAPSWHRPGPRRPDYGTSQDYGPSLMPNRFRQDENPQFSTISSRQDPKTWPASGPTAWNCWQPCTGPPLFTESHVRTAAERLRRLGWLDAPQALR
jgi:hypothetical protein